MKRILKINSTRLKILMLSCACIIGLGLSETSAITVTSPRDGDCLVTAQAGDFISVQLMADVNPALWFDAGGVDLTTVFEPGFAWDQSGLIEGTLLGTVSGNIVFNVTVRNPNDATDQEVDVELTICIERDPIDIIFCLDKSGSMGLKADPDCVSNCDTRMDVLKNVITGVVSLWVSTNSVSLNNSDRIGIIYFDSDAAAPPANFSLASIGSQGQLAWEDVELQNPGGSTAMGAALQEAINQLPSAADVTKTIVLFSDGDQNVAPLVDEGTLQIGGGSIIGQGAAAHLKIYAIGVGSTAGATLLNSISNATAVDPGLISLNAFDEETIDAFISALLDAIRQGSPQIVTRKTGNLVNAQATVTMKVNKRVEKVMFMLNGRITDELSFQVFKDGVDVTRTRLTRLLGDNGITVYSIPTPSKDRAGNPIVSEGTWEMRIRGGNDPNAKYDAWGFVEEENIKYITSQGSGFNAVGNPLEIKTEVMYGGSPVTDANVTAIILKPGEDIGDLLATTQTDDGFKALEQGLSPAEEKFQQLSTDPTFAEQLGLRPTPEITLTNNGDGSYSANFNDTDLAGTYRAIFRIEGTNASIGDFSRIEYKSTVLSFGGFDLDASVLTSILGDNGVVTSILFTPKNRFGKLMGPGMASYINLSTSQGSLGNPIDNLDGSYSFPVRGLSSGQFPEVSVKIFDKEEFKGVVSDEGPSVGTNTGDGGIRDLIDRYKYWIIIIIIVLIILSRLFKKK